MDTTVAPRRKSGSKVLSTLLILGLLVLVVILDVKRRQAEQKLFSFEQQTGNPAQGKEVAKQVVERVRKLIQLPTDVEPTVATIVDVEQLRQKNAFYNKAKNGDHLIVTSDRAILYDPIANIIIDVVPVQIQPPAAGAPAGQVSDQQPPAEQPPVDQPPAGEQPPADQPPVDGAMEQPQ